MNSSRRKCIKDSLKITTSQAAVQTILMKNKFRLVCFILCCALSHALADKQVSQLRAWHHYGQTFLTWNEVDPPRVAESMDVKYVRDTLLRKPKKRIVYFIYRSERPVSTVQGMKPAGTTGQLSCWNTDFYGIYPKKGQKVFRRKVRDNGPPLSHGTGVYVHNPQIRGA